MGEVVGAVQRDLERLPEVLQGSSTALAALALADAIDYPRAAMALAPMVRELRECMAELAAKAPPQAKGDPVDDLTAARAARRASASAG